MAYDPGALEIALAAAVGDDPGLIDELRGAFLASAGDHLTALRAARDERAWTAAALRMKGLAASFGARRLLAAAGVAAAHGRPDSAALRRIERALASIA